MAGPVDGLSARGRGCAVSAARQRLPPRLRAMGTADLARVVEIEQQAYSYPWSAGVFRDCLLAGYAGFVLEERGVILAYAIMSVAAGEAHVLNICVCPDAQGEGLGRRMMLALLEHGRQAGVDRVLLEVRPSNAIARRLYESLGFVEIGLRPRYYQASGGRREDAVVLSIEADALPGLKPA